MARRTRNPTLGDVGEIAILDAIAKAGTLPDDVVVGPGDDCAHLRLRTENWLWTSDSQIEGTHFERAWMTARQIGRKSYLVNASDIAAMGGRPRFVLVNIAAPSELPARDLAGIQRGISEMADLDRAVVVGGNLARSPVLEVTISLLGEASRRPILRSGARPGDALYVTGTLGDAALGVKLLRGDSRASGAAVRRFRQPSARIEAGARLAAEGLASAMIDLSDGLLDDLARLCRASGVGARVDPRSLPLSRAVRRHGVALALAGGEDYELLCAVPVRKEKRLEKLSAAELGCAMTRIGVVGEASAGVVVEGMNPAAAGFAHFTRGRRS